MNVLFISRSNTDVPHPFIKEQADVLASNHGVSISHLLVKNGGLLGYLGAVLKLLHLNKGRTFDILHAHYGLAALSVVIYKILFFNKTKIIITFHGSDINKRSERPLSRLAAIFATHNILVNDKMTRYFSSRYSIIPCGIDTNIKLNYRCPIRQIYGWGENDFVVLFSSNFDRKVKDPEFAFRVINHLKNQANCNVHFIELKGFTREQLTGLMQAADVLLSCSLSEGSPQIIKEAVLNTLPVVTNDVGDVKSICAGVDNCFIVEKRVTAYVDALQNLSKTKDRIKNNNAVINRYDNKLISKRIYDVYTMVLSSERQPVNNFAQ